MQTDKTTVNANEAQNKTFLDALETSGDTKNSNSIITSATQILKEGEHQWLNSEVINNQYTYSINIITIYTYNIHNFLCEKLMLIKHSNYRLQIFH